MARIQYTGLVSQIRGKIAGTVLSKISTGYTAYRKGQPRKQASPAQLNKRRGLAHNARRWAAVSPADKLVWASIAAARTFTDRIGEPVRLNAFELYRKILQSINPDGYRFSMVPNPSIDPAQEISFQVTALKVDLTDQGYYIDRLDGTGETINATTAGQVRVVYISLPLGADENYYSRTWYRVRTSFPAGINSIGQSLNWNANAVQMPKGWYTFDGARHRVKIQYIVPQGGWFSVEQFSDVVSDLTIPVAFPSFVYPSFEPAISWDGSSGIFDYFWTSAEKALIVAGYTQQTQAAAPQLDQSIPADAAFTASTSGGWVTYAHPSVIIPSVGGFGSNAYAWWYSGIGSSWTPAFGYYAPIRMRLVHTSSGQIGPWTYGFWPILLT